MVPQGAFRMRGIGKGQTVTMMMVPEVKALIERTLNPAGDGGPEEEKEQPRVLCDIATWLFVNSVKSEKVQVRTLSAPTRRPIPAGQCCHDRRSAVFHVCVLMERFDCFPQADMLAMQCIKNVWRKPAYRSLLASGGTGGDAVGALNAWREPMDLNVPNRIPSNNDFVAKIEVMCCD